MILRKLHTNSEEEIKGAFLAFDKDKNGFITAQEMFKVLNDLGEDFSAEEIGEMVRTADTDGDGKIDYEGELSVSFEIILI